MQMQSVNRLSERSLAGATVQPAGQVHLPGFVGLWAALCGVLSVAHWPPQASDLLTVLFVAILVALGWGMVWRLVTTTDWFAAWAHGRPLAQPVSRWGLPYTRPGSPAGRLLRWIGALAGWWRDTLWPRSGPAVMAIVVAAALVGASLRILPARLGPLHLAFVALVGLAILRLRRGKSSSCAEALAGVGLGWLAGYLAFAPVQWLPLALALCFALCAWGSLRIGGGQVVGRGGLWLLNGGLVLGLVLLIAAKQPLAAAGLGLALFGLVAVQLPLSQAGEPRSMARQSWPWLMAAMVVAALAIR